MKIRLISDLHLEFNCFDLPHLDTDPETVLVIAGDINPQDRLYKDQCGRFPEKSTEALFDSLTGRFLKILCIAGNHCYWRASSLDSGISSLRDLCSGYNDIEFMEQDHIAIGGVDFFGCTMWTDLDRANPNIMNQIQGCMNDFGQIGDFSTAVMVEKHEESRDWLVSKLVNSQRSVVITHHLPLIESVDPKYMVSWRTRFLNHAYYCDLSAIIESYKPKLWVHGHSHSAVDYMYGNTRIVNNPRGYDGTADGDHSGFDPNIILEV